MDDHMHASVLLRYGVHLGEPVEAAGHVAKISLTHSILHELLCVRQVRLVCAEVYLAALGNMLAKVVMRLRRVVLLAELRSMNYQIDGTFAVLEFHLCVSCLHL